MVVAVVLAIEPKVGMDNFVVLTTALAESVSQTDRGVFPTCQFKRHNGLSLDLFPRNWRFAL